MVPDPGLFHGGAAARAAGTALGLHRRSDAECWRRFTFRPAYAPAAQPPGRVVPWPGVWTLGVQSADRGAACRRRACPHPGRALASALAVTGVATVPGADGEAILARGRAPTTRAPWNRHRP